MANGLSPADGDAWGADWVNGSASSQQQPGLLDQLVRLLAGHVGNALGGGVTDLGNGLFHVPGTGVIRGYDGKIYPNLAARGGDGRLYVNPPGSDLQAMQTLLMQPKEPPGKYPAASDVFLPGQLPIRLGDQPGSVNVPNPTPGTAYDLGRFVVDPRLAPAGSPDVMPGATSAMDNYRRAYNQNFAPYAGNALLNQQTFADAYRKATGAEYPALR